MSARYVLNLLTSPSCKSHQMRAVFSVVLWNRQDGVVIQETRECYQLFTAGVLVFDHGWDKVVHSGDLGQEDDYMADVGTGRNLIKGGL